MKKKLITDNKEIKRFDFYRKNNIFILGEDNMNRKKGSFWGKTRDLDEHERGSGYHSEICR